MGLFDKLTTSVRRRFHQREIEASLEHYRRTTGASAEEKQVYSDAGSFRSQVDRLFTLGSAEETGELKHIAEVAASACLSNRYYRPADYLSDIVDALESRTFLTGEPLGKAPLGELSESHERQAKLEAVMEAWLVPLKVAAIESSLAGYSEIVGRSLPYPALQRFERAAARLFSLAGESELRLLEQDLAEILAGWKHSPALRERAPEPATIAEDLVSCFEGSVAPDGVSHLRIRTAGQPLRLSTVVPEERHQLLLAALGRWRQ